MPSYEVAHNLSTGSSFVTVDNDKEGFMQKIRSVDGSIDLEEAPQPIYPTGEKGVPLRCTAEEEEIPHFEVISPNKVWLNTIMYRKNRSRFTRRAERKNWPGGLVVVLQPRRWTARAI